MIQDCSHQRRLVVSGNMSGYLCMECSTIKFVDPMGGMLKVVPVQALRFGTPTPECSHKRLKVPPNGTLCEDCGRTVRATAPAPDNNPMHEQTVAGPFFRYALGAVCYECGNTGKSDATPYIKLEVDGAVVQAQSRIVHSPTCAAVQHAR